MKNRPQEHGAGSRGRKTRRWFLFGGFVLVLLAAIFRHPLQQRCLAYFVLRSEAPSDDTLSEVVEQASDPGTLLTKLWKTQRIPHRQFVLSFLSRVSTTKPGLFRTMEPVALEAVGDPDIATRESAFATLARMKHPDLRRLALEQLHDADPAARLIGLQSLRSIATSNDVSIAMRLLVDPEPRVAVAAALVLRQVTGQDFGIKSTHAIPQFTCIDTNPPPAPDLSAIARGVQRWQDWWIGHQTEYPPMPSPLASPHHAAPLPTPDFALKDSTGKSIQLSQLRGKSVLLAFWSLGAPASLDDVPALGALQRRDPERLAVLGICIPAAPSCAEEHEHGHEHGHDHAHHHHEESSVGGQGFEQMGAQVRQTSDRLKIGFPMLADPEGTLGSRFSANDLPIYVLIDSQGRIRRRFVGFRTETALSAMVEEVAGLGSTPTAQ